MRYAVTGAAGFIGSHLGEALQRAGHEVVGVDAFTDYYDPALKERNAAALHVRRLDLAEDELDFTGFDGVFHLAAQPGITVYSVGGGEEATMNETIALLERVAGRRLDVHREPAVAGDQRRTRADTARIQADLGWSPQTSLEVGLRAQWECARVSSPTT